MNTGENMEGLRRIKDMTRKASIVVLLSHFYVYCYSAFVGWHLVHPVIKRFLLNLGPVRFLDHMLLAKGLVLVLLLVSLLGTRGKKLESMKVSGVVLCLCLGLLVYFGAFWVLKLPISLPLMAGGYMGLSILGFLLILHGGAKLSRFIAGRLDKDVFNSLQESFPQEERLLETEVSINLPAVYQLRGRARRSWINIINPFRGILVAGTPGSGKSYFVIRHIINQHIKKGFSMFVYDFKYDDLTKVTYNAYLKYRHLYPVPPKFYVINFDDLSTSHRCNPLDPDKMTDIADAAEAARIIMLSLNREWIHRSGDFFVESPINFLTANIWYLKKYQGGRFCTLPHVMELMQLDYPELFTLLSTEPEIEALINPFISAYRQKAKDQLEGQVASAKIALARLISPQIYYLLSGNDFTLDINNPKEPKIVCVGNNYLKQGIYGAVLSLYAARMVKQVNKKDQLKSSLIFDEFPTIYFHEMETLLATGRSNRVACTICVQDLTQLRKDYGKSQADAIASLPGNVIAGQVTGDTARQLSERFGKIQQQRESFSIHSADTALNRSTQLDAALPPSRIARLSSGEMVGMVADDPDLPIELKMFHGKIQNDHQAIKKEVKGYKPLPVVRQVTAAEVNAHFNQIKEDVRLLANNVLVTLHRNMANTGSSW